MIQPEHSHLKDFTMIKPQLADDANLATLPYPVWGMPKIDGVRAMNLVGQLTGRSLDPFKGVGITARFSRGAHRGLDGEMTLGSKPNCTDRLCSLTTGAMGRFKGVTEMPNLHWWAFDYLTSESLHLDYAGRYDMLARHVYFMADERVHIVPYEVVSNREEAETFIARCLEYGYEGAIFRNPRAKAKPGRPGKVLQEYVRVKPWADAEMLVTGLTQGSRNENEAKTNTLGRTERSSAQAGLVPNGQIGSIQGQMLADFYCPVSGKLLFAKGLEITVSTGTLTEAEAARYWREQGGLVGHVVKFQHMTHGVKDLPRFGAYISHRMREDMDRE